MASPRPAAEPPPGLSDAAIGDAHHRLKRRVAAEQRRVVEGDAVVKDAGARARDRLVVDRVGCAQARLEHVPVHVREAARLAAEERQHSRVTRHHEVVAVAFEPVAWQDDAVVAIAADDPARRRVDDRGSGRIVEPRIEVRDVVRRRVPRRPDRPAEAALDGQVARSASTSPGRRCLSRASATS